MTPIIRPWLPADATALRGMIAACLRETVAQGADAIPTDDNVELLLRMGMHFAESGQPTLIALDGERPIGFVLWGGGDGDLRMRRKSIVGWGTYVLHEYRRQHVAVMLRNRAAELGRAADVQVVQGACYDAAALKSAVAAGFKVVASLVELEL